MPVTLQSSQDLLIFMLFSLCAIAMAEEQSPTISLTINPRQILNAFGEGSVEVALRPNIGLGGIAGIGRSDNEFQYNVGLHGRYYPFGTFAGGMYIGGQFIYLNLIHQDETDEVIAHLLYPGAFLGGKYIFDVGFTIDGQLGITHTTAVVKDQRSDSSIQTSNWDTLFNLNLGWSF